MRERVLIVSPVFNEARPLERTGRAVAAQDAATGPGGSSSTTARRTRRSPSPGGSRRNSTSSRCSPHRSPQPADATTSPSPRRRARSTSDCGPPAGGLRLHRQARRRRGAPAALVRGAARGIRARSGTRPRRWTARGTAARRVAGASDPGPPCARRGQALPPPVSGRHRRDSRAPRVGHDRRGLRACAATRPTACAKLDARSRAEAAALILDPEEGYGPRRSCRPYAGGLGGRSDASRR